jgi:hypothetical protein
MELSSIYEREGEMNRANKMLREHPLLPKYLANKIRGYTNVDA